MNFDHYSIRQICIEDLLDYFRLIDSNRSRLEEYFAGTVAKTQTIEDTQTFLTDILDKAKAKHYFSFIATDNKTGKLIASIQVKNIDWSVPKAELGYFIDAQYEGKGIITRAVSLVVAFCFSELKCNKLFIRTHESNLASRLVAERNGFIHEGTIRNDYKTTDGRLIDAMYYGRLPS